MATQIVSRAVKGTPLTVTEHDANHQNVADTADAATVSAATAIASAAQAQSAAATAQSTAQSAQSTANSRLPPMLLDIWTGAVKLDLEGGREYGRVDVTTATIATLTVTPAPVLNGCANVTFVRDGNPAHTLAFSGFTVIGDVLTNGAGDTFEVAFVKRPTSAQAYVQSLTPVAVPTASVANATPTRVVFTWPVAMDQTQNPAATTIVVTGHSVTAHTWTDATHSYATVTPGFTGGEAVRTTTYTRPGSGAVFTTLSGSPCASFGPIPITNNVGAVTLVDDFNRGDINPFDGIASDGGIWVGAITGFRLDGSNGTLSPIPGVSDIWRDLTAVDGYVEVDFHIKSAIYSRINFRGESNVNGANCLSLYCFPDGQGLILVDVTGGTDNNIDTLVNPGFVDDTTYKIRVDFHGSVITVKVNGVLKWTTSSALHATGTWVGLKGYGFGGGGTFFDNFISSNV